MLAGSDDIHDFILITLLSKLLRVEIARVIQHWMGDVRVTLVAPEGEVSE